MNELFPIKYSDADEPKVSARELHKALGIEKRFSAWFDVNSQGFICGEDYSNPYLEVRVQKEGSRDVQREVEDYDLSVDMAKHICLIYWKEDTWTFKGATMIRVDGENIKENTWYGLRNGKVIEIKED